MPRARRLPRVSLAPYLQEYQPLTAPSEGDTGIVVDEGDIGVSLEAGVASGGAESHREKADAAAARARDLDTSCVICLESFLAGESICRLPCGHQFHHECLTRWVCRRGTCPVCIQTISESARDYRRSSYADAELLMDTREEPNVDEVSRAESQHIDEDIRDAAEPGGGHELLFDRNNGHLVVSAHDSDLRAAGVVPRPMPPALVPLLSGGLRPTDRATLARDAADAMCDAVLREQLIELAREVLASRDVLASREVLASRAHGRVTSAARDG